jgi:hypothetical protein
MSSSSIPTPWSVADATFVEIEIRHPSELQMQIEFGCALRIVIIDVSKVGLAAGLIETPEQTIARRALW